MRQWGFRFSFEKKYNECPFVKVSEKGVYGFDGNIHGQISTDNCPNSLVKLNLNFKQINFTKL